MNSKTIEKEIKDRFIVLAFLVQITKKVSSLFFYFNHKKLQEGITEEGGEK